MDVGSAARKKQGQRRKGRFGRVGVANRGGEGGLLIFVVSLLRGEEELQLFGLECVVVSRHQLHVLDSRHSGRFKDTRYGECAGR